VGNEFLPNDSSVDYETKGPEGGPSQIAEGRGTLIRREKRGFQTKLKTREYPTYERRKEEEIGKQVVCQGGEENGNASCVKNLL